MNDLTECWQRIEKWLAVNLPSGTSNLAAPASADEIARIEHAFGAAVPEELAELLGIHNGEAPDEIWLFSNWSLLPAGDIVGERRDQISLSAEHSDNLETDDYVTPSPWHHQWYPFAYDGSGGYLCVDMAPTAAGIRGQILQTSSDGFARRISESMLALFVRFIEALERGDFEIYSGSLEADEWWR